MPNETNGVSFFTHDDSEDDSDVELRAALEADPAHARPQVISPAFTAKSSAPHSISDCPKAGRQIVCTYMKK